MLKRNGLTLVEVLISSVILTTALTGVLAFNSQYLKGLQGTRNFSLAMNAAQERFEKIKARVDPNDPTETASEIGFNNLPQYYDGITFDLYGNDKATALTNFKGVSYVKPVSNVPLTMYRIKVVVCWKETNNRVIGEDENFNGILDSGEDVSGNSEIDSPAFIQADIIDMRQ